MRQSNAPDTSDVLLVMRSSPFIYHLSETRVQNSTPISPTRAPGSLHPTISLTALLSHDDKLTRVHIASTHSLHPHYGEGTPRLTCHSTLITDESNLGEETTTLPTTATEHRYPTRVSEHFTTPARSPQVHHKNSPSHYIQDWEEC